MVQMYGQMNVSMRLKRYGWLCILTRISFRNTSRVSNSLDPDKGLTKCLKGVSVWSPNGTSIKLGLACKIRGGNPLKFTIIADHEPVKCTLVKAREND